jgi:hypothetical protein
VLPPEQILFAVALLVALVGAVDCVSIVTLNEQLEEPQALEAVQVTVVVPTTNVLPEAGEQLTVGVGVPVAVGSVHVTTGLHCEMLPGHAPITAPPLISTVNVHEELPQELVAVQVTVVVPVAKVEPDAGEHETVGFGSPVAVGSVHVATLLPH